VNLLASRWTSVLARAVLCVSMIAGLASCGSGAVSAPPAVVTPGPISITPSEATLYSDLPTTFIVSGGNGTYLVSSSNQAIVASVGPFTGNSFTVVPSPVASDTPITLSVRDTSTTAPASAALTVKPRTVDNAVTVTPTASQPAACGTAICSGGDAEVKVTMSQAGIPLRGRLVRFEVVSGDIRVIISPAGVPETLSISGTTTSDDTGTARMRIRVLADAPAQTAILQVTDTSTGFVQRTSVTIAPSSNAPLNAQPTTISFRGNLNGVCPTGLRADVIVFGGRPPYSISQPGTFDISPTLVTQNGGRFSVITKGQCSEGSPIAVVDSNGASVIVTASATTPIFITAPVQPALAVAPTTVTLDSCNTIATVTVAGGVGPPYLANSAHSSVKAVVDGNSVFISRVVPSPAIGTTSVGVSVSDGTSVKDVTVNLIGAGATGC